MQTSKPCPLRVKAVLTATKGDFRYAPNNGHHQTDPACLKGANSRLAPFLTLLVLLWDQAQNNPAEETHDHKRYHNNEDKQGRFFAISNRMKRSKTSGVKNSFRKNGELLE
jgi:hypothetical protein